MKILRLLSKVILALIIIAGLFVGTLTVFEYRPEDLEVVEVSNNQDEMINLDQIYQIMTFNIGYAGLGKDEDFVMDGGQKGRADSLDVVEDYFEGIKGILENNPSDFYLLQEVDQKARRSYNLNQVDGISNSLGDMYSSQYALNFKSIFVPFPLSLTDYIGPVESGIQTLSKYSVSDSERHQFPGAFSWPLRVANLKRAMMVSSFEISGSDKELIIVNLHMSAYDSDGSLRDQEMAYLKAFLEEQKVLGNYVVVGGDFNQTFPAAADLFPVNSDFYEAYTIEDDFMPNGYRFEVDLSEPTCRLLNQPYDKDSDLTQYYLIDGFIVSDNIELTEVQPDTLYNVMTINHEFLYSDHNPVVMKFKLNS
jgi:endonuclease/exonuclease/phosphatase family metal-dependent hydrolase